MNNSIWANFTGFQSQNVLNQNFDDTVIKSSEDQRATYERVASYCQSWYAPVFSNEKVPISDSVMVDKTVGVGVEVVPVDLKDEKAPDMLVSTSATDVPTTKTLTIPPIKIEQNDLLNAVLVGLGVVFVLKILE